MRGNAERTGIQAKRTRWQRCCAVAMSLMLALTLCPLAPQSAYAEEGVPADASEQGAETAAPAPEQKSAADDQGVVAPDPAVEQTAASDGAKAPESAQAESAPAPADPRSTDASERAAAGEITYIRSFSDLLAQVLLSRTADTSGVYYMLDMSDAPDKTLDLTSDQVDQIISQIGSLTFGSKDNPFRGTFDGNGYTIKGLNYERQLFVPAPDTGLFAWTDGAVIKNINFTDAYVGADYRGGVIVGCAKNTRLEHIKLTNCTSSVTPANNAVSLITNAGLAGGMVAGELENCVVYDVEVQGGRVINNSTVGVSGLGGEGLYLGALVGVAHNSTIEYSRVTPLRETQADVTKNLTFTQVHNKYDIAVGAVAGQAVYAGGICGSLYGNSANMVDCFSTADCYTYAATYVSVGAGNVGYVGGLVARTDEAVHVVRSHYAGNLHSYLYNAVLVIPIIQKNLYLGGLVEWDHDGGCTITNSYFAPHFSAEPGTNKDIPAIFNKNNKKVYSGASFGTQDETTYADRSFWESHDFDFTGGIERSTAYMDGAPHANRWVMDYDLGIPVHGDAVKATFDFPGAGTAGIGESDVLGAGRPQSTSTPYEFAVQGFMPSDFDMDFSMTLNGVSPETTPAVSDAAHNGGYRFNGWYRQPDVRVDKIDESHAFFDPVVSDPAKCVSADAAYTARNTGPGTAEGFAGGDLFVAYCQGQVLFHDVAGNVVNTAGAPDADTSDDWYDHEAALPQAAEPQADRTTGGVGPDAVFLGWTWLPHPVTGGGYPSVTASQMGDIEQAGAFVKAGDAIVQPMDLYPVYADYASNIITRFEGNEQDASDDFTLREGVGRTDVVKKQDGRYAVTMTGAQNDGTLPDGYRFLGWYEQMSDGSSRRVADTPEYVLPEEVDLTQQHTYEARLEYRVDYMIKSLTGDGNMQNHKEYALGRSVWQPYRSAFQVLDPAEFGVFYGTNLQHWSAAPDPCSGADALTADYQVVSAMQAYGHMTKDREWDVKALVDFPGAGTVNFTGKPNSLTSGIGDFAVHVTAQPGYTFWFWAAEGSGGKHNLSAEPDWDRTRFQHNTDRTYEYVAHMTADVVFHEVPAAAGGVSDVTVQRQYLSTILKDAAHDPKSDFSFPLSGNPIAEADLDAVLGAQAADLIGEPSPSDASMYRPGYRFLGWIDGTAGQPCERGGALWNAIYNTGDGYCTADADLALNYTIDVGDETERATDLYPVYAKYAYDTTTNIARSGVVAGSGVNVPLDPTAELAPAENDDYTIDVRVTADTSTLVSADGVPYELKSWTVERSDGAVRTVDAVDAGGAPAPDGTPVSNEHAVLTYKIAPGYTYTFVANYEPLAVVYHVAEGKTATVVRNQGDPLGKAPEGVPAFDMNAVDAAVGGRAVFVGWTEQRPADGAEYALWAADGTPALTDEHDAVEHAMELFAVYRVASVTVNSNIDDVLAAAGVDPSTVRTLARGPEGALMLQAAPYAGYEFKGWYEGYVSAAEPGSLVSAGEEHALDARDVFSGAVYTAVFERVHEVRYHGTDGGVLFTAHVSETEGRSFVTQEPGPDGMMQDVVLDSEAWQAIAAQLDASTALDMRELFNTWQWVRPDASIAAWDEFCRTPIASDMDLYPVTRQVRSADAAGAVNTDDLLWALDSHAETPVKAYFKAPYAQARLTVNVQQVSYAPTPEGAVGTTFAPLSDRNVALYVSSASTDPTVKPTNAQGNAVFDFDAVLTLVKRTKDSAAAGQTFALTVEDAGPVAPGQTPATRMVFVDMPAAPDADGFYSARVTLAMPVGRYKVSEDAAWAWRYEATIECPQGTIDPADPSSAVLDLVSPATVTCTNTLKDSSWLDGSVRAKNEFAAQHAAASAQEGGEA